ncbi:MAG TPA: NADH-quinone oxidoreductase subunit N [Candidatus Methanoperedenaceae archaeon]|nr:NADH-quinone oxidoreductase subunit N [Candidatus Methanoperedenaceae archaeon]
MTDYSLIIPEAVLSASAILVILLGLVLKNKRSLAVISAAALLVSIIAIFVSGKLTGGSEELFYRTMVVDPLSQVFKLVFAAVTLLTVIASIRYYRDHPNQDEYYALLLFATVGMMLAASANDITTLFVGFELASLSTYVLAGFDKKNAFSVEASLKYFLIGSFSSAILLFGLSLVYGTSGGLTNIPDIVKFYSENPAMLTGAIGVITILTLIAGFAFKMALVPFHMWAPDTYQAAPDVVAAMLAAGSKKMGFVAAFRVLLLALIVAKVDIRFTFAILAVLTMTFGNLVAISQRSIKRMLAYSSIAQAGYISMAFVVMSPLAVGGGILLAIGHAFMKGGAFLAVAVVTYMILSDKKDSQGADHLDNFAGLGKRAPVTAFALAVFAFALAGIPPTAGFVGKFVLFSATIETPGYIWLAVIAILNSALSLYYYARLVKYMYVLPPAGDRISEPIPYVAAITLALLVVLIIGLYPEPFIDWSVSAANAIGVR